MGCWDSPVPLCSLSLQLHAIWILQQHTAETAFSKVTGDRSTSLMAFPWSSLPASRRDQTLMIAFHVLVLPCLSSMLPLAPSLVTGLLLPLLGGSALKIKTFAAGKKVGPSGRGTGPILSYSWTWGHQWSYPYCFEFPFGFYSLPFQGSEPPQLAEIYPVSV